MLRISKRNLGYLLSWLLVLSLFSYPISTVFFLKTGIPTSAANFILKSFFAVGYLIVFLFAVYLNKRVLPKRALPLLLFLLIYSIRLLIDTTLRNVEMAFYSNQYLYSYYFGLTVLPCICLILCYQFLDWNYFYKLIFWFILVANLSFFFYFFSEGTKSVVEQFATRAQANVNFDPTKAVINPIIVGLYGVLLIVMVTANFVTNVQKSLFFRISLLAMLPLAFANVMLGASRGPIFVLAVITLFITVYIIKKTQLNLKSLLIYAITMFGFVVLYVTVLAPFLQETDIFLFERLGAISELLEGSRGEDRNYQWVAAWEDFLASPVIGNRFVSTYDNFYPHNLILEILMSLGILGIITFLVAFVKVLRSLKLFWRHKMNSELSVVFLIAGCQILTSMTSGSIVSNPEFWIFFLVLTLIPSINNQLVVNKNTSQ